MFFYGKFFFIILEIVVCKVLLFLFFWLYLFIREDSLFLFEEIFLWRCVCCLDEFKYDKVKIGLIGRKLVVLNMFYIMILRKYNLR